MEVNALESQFPIGPRRLGQPSLRYIRINQQNPASQRAVAARNTLRGALAASMGRSMAPPNKMVYAQPSWVPKQSAKSGLNFSQNSRKMTSHHRINPRMKSYLDKAIDKFSEWTIEAALSSLNGHTLLIDTSLTSVNLPESVRFASGTLEICL